MSAERTRWAVLAAIALLVVGFVGFSASAAIIVSDLVLDARVPAGGAETYVFQVTNTGDEAVDVTITYYDWSVDERGNHQFFVNDMGIERSLRGLVEFSPAAFRLESQQARDVRVTIRSTQQADGTYWGMLMVENEAPAVRQDVAGAFIHVQVRYGVKLYNTVPGTERPAGAVERVAAAQPAAGEPPMLSLTFMNSGNVKLAPNGWFEIRDGRGQPVWRTDFEGRTVPPGSRMLIEQPYDGVPLPAGQYLLLGVVDYGGDRLVGGQVMMTVHE